jgi:hypothetical protein
MPPPSNEGRFPKDEILKVYKRSKANDEDYGEWKG